MTSQVTPRSIESTNDERAQHSRVNSGLVVEGTKRTVPARLSDDVHESLLPDVR